MPCAQPSARKPTASPSFPGCALRKKWDFRFLRRDAGEWVTTEALIIRCNKRVISCGLWREPLWNDSLLLKRIQRRTSGLFSHSKSIFLFSTHPSPPSTPSSTALYYIPDTSPIFFFFLVRFFFFFFPNQTVFPGRARIVTTNVRTQPSWDGNPSPGVNRFPLPVGDQERSC